MRDTYEEGQIYQRRIDALQKERDGVRHDYLDAMAQLDQATQECVALAFERDSLRTENSELKQRCMKMQQTLSFFSSVIKSGEAWSSTCQRELEAALAPDSGADCGTREQNMKVIRDALMDGHPNPEGFLEWCDAQTDEKVAEIAADCGTKEEQP